MADAQHRRITGAMALVVAEQGYAATSVADVIGRAGVSRETYYQQFRSKLDCFLAAFDDAAAQLFAPIRAVAGPVSASLGPADRLARFDQLLEAYLRGLTTQPELAKVFLVEVYAAGPEAIARRVALQAEITAAVATLLGASDDRGRFACRALVAATSALVTPLIASGDLAGIVALREPIVDLAAGSLLS
ncbi:TetR/AcrR family transcriptional regulator [Aquihabitans daechungensis]|uniref:TetR/AcrR family transcriptional regulator n=1 Tax=Aquihabitans daechungensis TaxID=1052257 RepID=UPI003BA385D5